MIDEVKSIIAGTSRTTRIALVVWLMLLSYICIRGCLHYNGNGADAIGKQLEQIGSTQSTITDELNTSRDEAESIRTEISEARDEVSQARVYEQGAGEIIADCQRILQAVRSRGQVETTKN